MSNTLIPLPAVLVAFAACLVIVCCVVAFLYFTILDVRERARDAEKEIEELEEYIKRQQHSLEYYRQQCRLFNVTQLHAVKQ